MGNLILQKGDIISLKVTNIHPTGKPVNKQSGKFYQYHITMEDKKGDFVLCEYLSPIEEQDKFYMGLMQYIEVKYLSQKGTPEVEPCEPPTKQKYPTLTEVPGATPGNTSHVDVPSAEKKGEANCYSVPAHGKAITFAMGYAKDILVAEIAANPRKVTSEDIDRMTGWADQINQKICDRIQF